MAKTHIRQLSLAPGAIAASLVVIMMMGSSVAALTVSDPEQVEQATDPSAQDQLVEANAQLQDEAGSTGATGAPAEEGEPSEALPVEEVEVLLTETEQWELRVDTLDDQLLVGEKSQEDADALYAELSATLREKQRQLRATIASAKPWTRLEPIEELHSTNSALYDLRIRLLKEVTPDLRTQATGAGLEGMRELRVEIEHVALHFAYLAVSIPRLAAEWRSMIGAGSIRLIWTLLQVGLALIIFRAWRGWAPAGLEWLRSVLLDIRPRTRGRIRTARFIWYLDRVRKPLEWIVLASFLISALEMRGLEDVEKVLSIVVLWILLAWFAVALLNAYSSRSASSAKGEIARLRLRSYRLIAAWLVLLGLGRDLGESYAGEGTIYAWVQLVFRILAVPLLLLLIVWWRPTIFGFLENEAGQSDWARRILARKKGLRSFPGAAIGGAYLLVVRILRAPIVKMAGTDWGRPLLANIYRFEVGRKMTAQGAMEKGQPISDELKRLLLTGAGGVVEKSARTELRRILELEEAGEGGVVAVVSNRGWGKSLLLKRLSSACQGRMLMLDCPPGGSEAFRATFVRALGLSAEEATSQNLKHRLGQENFSIISVDNYHRLARPVMGGLAEMDKVSELAQQAHRKVLWVVTLNSAAWRYIQCARSKHLNLNEVFELPGWTEEQIGELIELRCAEAGITPDFGHLALPRRIDALEGEKAEDRNKRGIYRLLWDAAQGSPRAALRLWAKCLAEMSDGSLAVQLPSTPTVANFEKCTISVLLTQRVIIQCELATSRDIAESLRISPAETNNALRYSLQQGWIEEVEGYYRVSDNWFGPVTRALTRRNLLSR